MHVKQKGTEGPKAAVHFLTCTICTICNAAWWQLTNWSVQCKAAARHGMARQTYRREREHMHACNVSRQREQKRVTKGDKICRLHQSPCAVLLLLHMQVCVWLLIWPCLCLLFLSVHVCVCVCCILQYSILHTHTHAYVDEGSLLGIL